jgi:hypothetical protein
VRLQYAVTLTTPGLKYSYFQKLILNLNSAEGLIHEAEEYFFMTAGLVTVLPNFDIFSTDLLPIFKAIILSRAMVTRYQHMLSCLCFQF